MIIFVHIDVNKLNRETNQFICVSRCGKSVYLSFFYSFFVKKNEFKCGMKMIQTRDVEKSSLYRPLHHQVLCDLCYLLLYINLNTRGPEKNIHNIRMKIDRNDTGDGGPAGPPLSLCSWPPPQSSITTAFVASSPTIVVASTTTNPHYYNFSSYCWQW